MGFRRETVELIRSGTPLKQVADELCVSEQTFENWRAHGDVDAYDAEGLTSDESSTRRADLGGLVERDRSSGRVVALEYWQASKRLPSDLIEALPARPRNDGAVERQPA